MEGLEALYQLETGAAFGELGSLSGNKEFKLYRFPWEEWAGKFKYAKEGLPVLLRCFNKAFIEPNKDSPIFCNLMLRGKFEPWEEWAGKFKYAKEGLPVLLRCFNKAFIEPNKDSPIFCNLMLRGKFEDLSSNFDSRKKSELWMFHHQDENGNFTGFRKYLFFDLETDLQIHLTDKQGKPIYSRKKSELWMFHHQDENGNFTGFRKYLFFDLETDLQIHLTDKQGKPIYIHPDENLYLLEGGYKAQNKDTLNIWYGLQIPLTAPYQEIAYLLEGGYKAQNKDTLNIWYGLQIPLTAPYQEIAGGHISLSFYMPEKYNRIAVPIKEFGNKPVQVTWGSMTFSIEKVDNNGFIISTDAEKNLETNLYR